MKTLKEKAQAYDKAIERAKIKLDCCDSDSTVTKNTVYDLFPELCESEDKKIREELIHLVKKSHEQGGYALHKWEVDEILTWLEKQGKQTPADKVEPKFKVGDLVVDNCGNVWKIEGILNQFYLLEGVEGGESRPTIEWVNKTFHLWTIEYAKSGDVLVNGSNIFIFHFINDTRLMGYCHINTDDGRFYDDIGKNECFCLIDAVVHPATEEQRETLMKAMADAGYTFDFEKKELKEIATTRPMLSDFFNAEYERGKADALQSIEWNEEDESMYTRTLGILGKCYMGTLPTKVEEELNWFKSLKQKIGE